MSKLLAFTLFSSLTATSIATPLQVQDVHILSSISPANRTSVMLPRDVSSLDGFDINCDGATYGFNPNIADCDQAHSYIVPDTEQLLFGERHTGLPDASFVLPFSIFGGNI